MRKGTLAEAGKLWSPSLLVKASTATSLSLKVRSLSLRCPARIFERRFYTAAPIQGRT